MKTIDAGMLRRMFLSGAKNLDIKKNWINELNVFPVPDGDTGTNMTMTIMSAAQEVNRIAGPTMESLAKSMSSGSLKGARGNSGVILSQLIRGFTKGIRDHEELDALIISDACGKAVETAYKAVMKPKEGTILTVARMMAEKAEEIASLDIELEDMFKAILDAGDEALARTPELLPVLKEAGVVDSGGQGLMTVVHGAVDAFNGLELELDFAAPPVEIKQAPTREHISTDDIKFGYCTEFIVKLEREISEEEEDAIKEYLLSLGDSLVFVVGDGLIKVHVHTNHPGRAFEKGLEYGQLTRMKVDNMREEHDERLFNQSEMKAYREKEAAKEEEKKAEKAPRKDHAFISVTVGDGLSQIFRDLGVDVIIEGGQTMNPSTDDMLSAISEANAENVFILPNNKNVILAANQARSLVEDCNIFVVPTKTVPQGITAVVSYVPERSAEDNAEAMAGEIGNVKTGEITYAVRDTRIDGTDIHVGDIMGLGDDGLLAVGRDVESVVRAMLEKMVDEDSELISIYRGKDYSEEAMENLAGEVEETFGDCDVEVSYGGQPIYYVIISVE